VAFDLACLSYLEYFDHTGSSRSGYRILRCRADQSEPTNWQPVGSPLLGQSSKEYNARGPSFPFLLPVTEARWLLYFAAWGHKRADDTLPNTPGVAVSDDGGETFEYHPEHPTILMDQPWDAEAAGSNWVLLEDGLFRMYYTGIGRYYERPADAITGHGDVIPAIGVGYAESDDGIHWHKPLNRLSVAPRGFNVEPYEYICSSPCVIRHDNGYIMWVNTFGTAYRVHRLHGKMELNGSGRPVVVQMVS
jgi:hypothetical protein